MRKTSTKKVDRRRPRRVPSEDDHAPEAEATGAGRLSKYQEKRNLLQTNEPFGTERTASGGVTNIGRFVVHMHDATRRHFDLWLQVGGVLKSFAVPKGPSLDPAQKRLAILTEDHPIEYLDFEAVIPSGNYGAGAMILWDTGWVRYLEGSAEEGLRRGKLDLELYGFRLQGRFALVQSAVRSGDPKHWLLFKKDDAHASSVRDPATEEPHSVLSGLTVEELSDPSGTAKRFGEIARGLGAVEGPVAAEKLSPMLCAADRVALDDPNWTYELKLDGVRIIADKRGSSVALRYRNGRLATTSYPEIARAVASMVSERLLLDGEIVALDEAGRPNFERLAPRIHVRRPLDALRLSHQVPVVFMVFDVLALEGWDLMPLPLVERKRLLAELVQGKGYVRRLDHALGQGQAIFDFCQKHGLEGVVAKRLSSTYQPGPRRSGDWVKVKREQEADFVVIGWLKGKRGRDLLGALCVASFSGAKLRVRGRVGSGLTRSAIDELLAMLPPLRISEYPAEGELPEDLKQAYFVRPEVVIRVRFSDFSKEGRLRTPVFVGIRPDVDPSACTAQSTEELVEALTSEDYSPPSSGPSVRKEDGKPASQAWITNRDKVFWPEDGYTKGHLIDYYGSIAPTMLSFLRARPVVMVRYPNGIHGEHFYQWNAPAQTPEWIRTFALVPAADAQDDRDHAADGARNVFLVDSSDGLVYLAQLGCIPIHVLASRENSPDLCDFVTIDFDIGARSVRDAVLLAHTLKELLEELGMVGYPKTSGQSGLHVLIPMGSGIRFEAAKILVDLLGELVAARHPRIATTERRLSKRGDRVYVDTGQTGYHRTIVAPYSVRAVPGAKVSTPLRWEDVHAGLNPDRFTILTVPQRVAELPDPMADFHQQKPDLARALEALGARVNEY